MSLTRWQPLQEMMSLRDTMDRFFADPFFQPVATNGVNGSALPLDIIERDNELVVQAAAPGYTPEQIEVSVQGDLLTLRGALEQESERKEENYHLRERMIGSFQRTVRLPASVDADQATAEYANGVLTLNLPKTTEASAKKIKIQG